MIVDDYTGLFAFGAQYIVAMGDARRYKRPFRIVQYYYPLSDLKEEVYKRTSVLAKHTPSKEGSQFDKGTLSDDESVVFEMLCRQAADEVATVMMPFLPVTQRSYMYDKGYVTTGDVSAGDYAMSGTDLYMARVDSNVTSIATDDFEKLGADVSHSVHFICKKGVDVYENSVESTDQALREMLVGYIVKEWVMMTLPERAEQYEAMYERARERVRFGLNNLIKPVRGGHPF